MGKTYKAQSDIDYFDDLFDDDLGVDLDFDDDMDLFLNRQMAGSSSKRNRGNRGRKNSVAFDDASRYRLPRDWQDFDYAPESQISDDWR